MYVPGPRLERDAQQRSCDAPPNGRPWRGLSCAGSAYQTCSCASERPVPQRGVASHNVTMCPGQDRSQRVEIVDDPLPRQVAAVGEEADVIRAPPVGKSRVGQGLEVPILLVSDGIHVRDEDLRTAICSTDGRRSARAPSYQRTKGPSGDRGSDAEDRDRITDRLRERSVSTVASPNSALRQPKTLMQGFSQTSMSHGHGGLGARNTLLLSALVGHRQQAADAACDGILRQRAGRP